jgi:hypothetical protein
VTLQGSAETGQGNATNEAGQPARERGKVVAFGSRIQGVANTFPVIRIQGKLQGVKRSALWPSGVMMSERDLSRDADLQQIYRDFLEKSEEARQHKEKEQMFRRMAFVLAMLAVLMCSLVITPSWPAHAVGWAADKAQAFSRGWSHAFGEAGTANAAVTPATAPSVARVQEPVIGSTTNAGALEQTAQGVNRVPSAPGALAGAGLVNDQRSMSAFPLPPEKMPPAPVRMSSVVITPPQLGTPTFAALSAPRPVGSAATASTPAAIAAQRTVSAPASSPSTPSSASRTVSQKEPLSQRQAPEGSEARAPDVALIIVAFVEGAVMLRDPTNAVKLFRLKDSIAPSEQIESIDAVKGVVSTNRRTLRKLP